MERLLVANHLVPDNEVWVSLATYDEPFGLKARESTATVTQQANHEICAHYQYGEPCVWDSLCECRGDSACKFTPRKLS